MKPVNSSTGLAFLVVFFFCLSHLLLLSSTSDARSLQQNQHSGEGEEAILEANKTVVPHFAGAEAKDFKTLMGITDSEAENGCQEKEEEECMKRRVIADAHLDYIYTQNHKP